jgi:hypothetical protein
VPPVPGLWLCFTHSDCVCNQVVSATNRVLGSPPQPTKSGLQSLRREAKSWSRELGTVIPWTHQQVCESFKDHRKPRYLKAAETLKERAFTRDDAKVNAFIKSEKFNPLEKVNPDPRMIQARGLRYNLELAKYTRPMENRIYKVLSKRGLREIAKGLNQLERAELIKQKCEVFADFTCFSLDSSRWDQHVSAEVLKIEHSIYLRMCNEPELQSILAMQIHNFCSTRSGTKWRSYGRRMSGDMTTALGNCALMRLMIKAAMRQLGVPFEIVDDGDDCLLFVPGELAELVRAALPNIFLEFGQELKLENEAKRIEDIVFCQSKVIETVDGPKMVRPWRKVLAHGTSGVKYWGVPNLVRPMCNAVGSCELALNAGVPVLQAYACALRRFGKEERLKRMDLENTGLLIRARAELHAGGDFEQRVYGSKTRPVTAKARESFERTWGVPVAEQLAIEGILDRWTLLSTEAMDFPLELDSSWEDRSAPELRPPETY